jgi:ATP-binding cassette, subfamily F, member 1
VILFCIYTCAVCVVKSYAKVVRNERLRIGRYTQHFVDTLPLDQTPVSYLQELGSTHDSPPFQAVQRCRAQVPCVFASVFRQAFFIASPLTRKWLVVGVQLGRYGLEGHAHTITVNKLSGGQKARVVFAGFCVTC